jgi:hypothetical protein
MDRYQSLRHPPRRTEHRSSARYIVAVVLTTAMVATGGFGTLPDNLITEKLQDEIGKNVPESILEPVNSYLEQLSAPTIQPQYTAQSNTPIDLIGLIFENTITGTAETLNPVTTETITPVGTTSLTNTPDFTLTSTSTLIITSTDTSTATPTRTFTPTSTPIATATPICSRPSTTLVSTTFFNSSFQSIDIYWVDVSCRLVLYRNLSPGQSYIQQTYVGHFWQFRDSSTGQLMADYIVSSANEVVDVSTGVVSTATSTPIPTVTAAPFFGFAVSNVDMTDDLTQFGTSITLAPGADFYVFYDFQVFNDPCPSCITQLVTGLGSPGSHGGSCAYNGIPGVFPGVSGSEMYVTLTAPSTPGTYQVIVEYHWEFTCADALANYGSGGAAPVRVIGQVTVQ